MPIHYEGLDWEDEAPPESARAVFRDTCTHESRRLTLAQINRIFGGDLEEVDGVAIPDDELRRAVAQLSTLPQPG